MGIQQKAGDSFLNNDVRLFYLKKLVLEKRYNEAEDELFKYAEGHKDVENIEEVGEWFYSELSKQKDEDLLNNGFSREEIKLGLADFKNIISK